jgi:hypothetical protein
MRLAGDVSSDAEEFDLPLPELDTGKDVLET